MTPPGLPRGAGLQLGPVLHRRRREPVAPRVRPHQPQGPVRHRVLLPAEPLRRRAHQRDRGRRQRQAGAEPDLLDPRSRADGGRGARSEPRLLRGHRRRPLAAHRPADGGRRARPRQRRRAPPTHPVGGFKTAAELSPMDGNGHTYWDDIAGDPEHYVPALSPFMVESTVPRVGTDPITGIAHLAPHRRRTAPTPSTATSGTSPCRPATSSTRASSPSRADRLLDPGGVPPATAAASRRGATTRSAIPTRPTAATRRSRLAPRPIRASSTWRSPGAWATRASPGRSAPGRSPTPPGPTTATARP